MMGRTVNIQTTQTFENLLNSTKRVSQHIGGTRSGKTYAIIQFLIAQSLENDLTITMVRQTIPSLKRTLIKDFKDILTSLDLWIDDNFNIADRTYRIGNSFIQFINTDDADKLRGIKSDILFIDEASEVTEDSYFQLSIRTTGKIILAYNPTVSPYHWLRQMGDCDRYVTTYRDNPFLPSEMVKAIEDLQYTNEKKWLVYGKGEFTGNDKAIFEFDIIDDTDGDFIAFGFDVGYSNDPSSLVAIYKKGDELHLEELLYETRLVTTDIIERFRKLEIDKSHEIFCDSSEPRLIEEIYRSGFNIKPVVKGKDSINFGIEVMRNYKIKVLKKSQNLINEMYGYEYITDKNGYVTDKPQDFNNHAIDAARYACMMKLSQKAQSKGVYAISVGKYRY
jgi:phage terminase large subunit